MQERKLVCPACEAKFKTTIRNKVFCSSKCVDAWNRLGKCKEPFRLTKEEQALRLVILDRREKLRHKRGRKSN